MPANLNEIIKDSHSYLEAIATSNKLIGHTADNARFAVMGIDELMTTKWKMALSENFGLVSEAFEGKLSGKGLHDADAKMGSAFWILKYAGREDWPAIKQVAEDAFTLGIQVIAKIKKDQEALYSGEGDLNQLVKVFNIDSVMFNKVGPVGDNYHGYRFEFGFTHNNKLEYLPDNWL